MTKLSTMYFHLAGTKPVKVGGGEPFVALVADADNHGRVGPRKRKCREPKRTLRGWNHLRIDYNGRRVSLRDLSLLTGVSERVMYRRIKRGRDPLTPVRKRKVA